MINQVVMLLSRWAADAEHGVNELAQSIPRSNFAPAPDDPAPPLVAFFSDVDDAGTAREMDPPDVPALVFWGMTEADMQPKGQLEISRKISIAAAYVTAEDADPLTAIRDCGYILRAEAISLMARFNRVNLSKSCRELNGIRITHVTDVNEYRLTASVGRRKMWGLLEINATVIETLQ